METIGEETPSMTSDLSQVSYGSAGLGIAGITHDLRPAEGIADG